MSLWEALVIDPQRDSYEDRRRLFRQNFRGWESLVNKDLGYAPYWSAELRRRINQKKATNVVITGEPGNGKTYLSTDIARISEGLTDSGRDRFKLNQVVFTYSEYLKQLISSAMGKIIIFDEPSYAMGKREWYKDLNKALVKTIESQRFKVHPLFIPIINKALLDKTIRSYLIQFQIEVRDRGRAVVYRIYPSQHTEKIYRYTFCYLEYSLFDQYLCSIDSCLDCPKLTEVDDEGHYTCRIFRARYERKKANIQDVRYEQALDQAHKKESKDFTFPQIIGILQSDEEINQDYEEEDAVTAVRIREILRDKYQIFVSRNKAYELRSALLRELSKRKQ